MVGTLAYMPPERLSGAPDDPRGDVYALACVLYECLTGQPPFGAGDPAAQVGAHLHGPPPRPSAVRAELAPFDEVIAAGMAKRPEDRTPTAGALARAAAQALGGAAHPLPTSLPGAVPPATAAWTGARPDPQRIPAPGPPPTLVPGPPSGWPPAGPTPDPTRPGAPRRRTGLALLLVAALVVAAATAAVFLVLRNTPPPTPVGGPAPSPPTTTTQAAVPAVTGTIVVGGTPSALVLAPDGRTAFALTARLPGQDEVVRLDLAGGGAVGTPIDVSAAGGGVALAPDGRNLHVSRCGAALCSLDTLDAPSGTALGGVPLGEIPTSVVVDAEGRRAYVLIWQRVAGVVETEIAVVDLPSRATVGEPLVVASSGSGGLALSPDGERLYLTDGRGAVSVIDTGARVVLGRPVSVGDGAGEIAVAPDGTRAYVANAAAGTVAVLDLGSLAVLDRPVPVGAAPEGLAVSPDSSRVYVANRGDGTLSVIDTATAGVVGEPVPVGREPTAVAVSPDGSRVYVVNQGDGTISVLAMGT